MRFTSVRSVLFASLLLAAIYSSAHDKTPVTTTTSTTVKRTTTTTTCPKKNTTTTTTLPQNPPPSEVTVFGPQTIEVGWNGSTTYSKSFNGISSVPQNGHLLLTLGGDDRKCELHPSILCWISQTEELFFRPDDVEISLNGKVVLKQHGYPNKQKYDSVNVVVDPANQIQVKLKGFPFSFVQVEVKSQGSVQHPNPIASFTVNPTSGIAPQLFTLNALPSTASGAVISSYAWDFGDGTADTGSIVVHNYNSAGNYTVKLTVTDSLGGVGTVSKNISVVADQPPVPSFAVTAHPENTLELHFDASASSDPDGSVVSYIWNFGDGQTGSGVVVDHTYSAGGTYTIQLMVTDDKGTSVSASQSFTVVQIFPPVASLTLKSSSSGTAPLMALFDGTQSADPQGLALSYTWDFGDGNVSNDVGLATHLYQNPGSYTIKMTVSNQYGLSDSKTVSVQATVQALPADPKTLAPPLVQNNVKTPFANSVSFLYSGSNPTQTNVNTAAIDPTRVSVLRGQVVDDNGQPISGVKVTINQGTDFGQTLTGTDGFFNMAVNGGGSATVQYEKSGYLPAQRTVKVFYNDFATAEKTILVATDAKVTKIQNASAQTQMAKGSVSSDNDGQRTAVLMIPPSTTASIELPNGGTMVLPSLSLRMTEYTVGTNGPQRMPASLPTTTSYTYAVDITSDEALALGAKHIHFSQPVSFYVDNFLGFPVGMTIPVGSYDYDKGAWQASENGRVMKVLSISGGQAVLDVSGSGQASAADLATLGITSDELTRIASSYSAGSTFWRARAARFSPFDLNVLAGGGGLPPTEPADSGNTDEPANQCPVKGSRIDVLSQNLGEEVPVIGTDLKLMYNSKNSKNTTNTTVIKITDNQVPAEVEQIDLTIEVAGRVFQQTFTPAPNLYYTFVWDGFDVYGRSVDGKIKGHVTIGYRYPQDYLTQTLQFPNEFDTFGVNLQDTNVPGRTYSLLEGSYDLYFGKAALPETSVGQWTISNYHHYDPQTGILYYGDGSSLGGVSPVFKSGRPVEVVMGNGTAGTSPDGAYAVNSQLTDPYSLRLGKDRSIYFSENYQVIRRIKPDGTLQTIAGTPGQSGYTGDGGPATQATLSLSEDVSIVEGEENEYYIADVGNYVIRKVDKNGIISTFAGNGTPGFSGDGGPATQAQLEGPRRSGLGLIYYQGSLFIADTGNARIRQVTPDGIIRTVVGNGVRGDSPDGTQAASASLIFTPGGQGFPMAFTKDGELLFVDGFVIRKVNHLGQLVTVAGSNNPVGSKDGIMANTASISPSDIKAMDDGSIYWVDGSDQIRYMAPDGTLQTLAGNGDWGLAAAGTFAKDSPFQDLAQFDISQNGDVYVVEMDSNRILKIPGSLDPTLQSGYYRIASADGSEIYYFDENGFHQKTTFGATDTLKYEFDYDANNNLIVIKDAWGNATSIGRDGTGNVNSITSPYGQLTSLGYDAQNRLAQVTLPNGDNYGMGYYDTNLLNWFRKPNGAVSSFGYDTRGNLVYDQNAAGGSTSLSDLFSTATTKTVNTTTAQGISETRSATTLYADYMNITQSLPTGEQVTSSGSSTYQGTSSNTGVYTSSQSTSDPRLGQPVLMPLYSSTTQGAYTRSEGYSHQYDRFNSISDYKIRETRNVNSVSRETKIFDSVTRTMASTSALGRGAAAQFNENMQLVSSQVGALAPISYQYDSRGNLSSTAQGDRTTSITYGSNGMPSSIQDGLGNTTSFEYDQNLRKTKVIYPNGAQVSYQYDGNNNITSITPAGRSPHVMNFNLVDLLTAYLPPQLGGVSTTTSYQYDLDQRMTQIQRPDGQQITMKYETTSGLLSQIQTPGGNYNFAYNLGRLTSASSPDGISTSIGYTGTIPTSETTSSDAFNFQTSKTINALLQTSSDTFGGVTVNYGYDQDDMLVSAGSESLSYDSNSLLQTISAGNTVQSNSYNNLGEVTSTAVNAGSSVIFSQTLTRDKNGRISSVSEGANNTNYTYDSVGRLVDVAKNGVSVGHYTYDDNGNRINATIRGRSYSATYDSQDRIISYGTKSYIFDAAGELVSVTDSSDMTSSSYSSDVYGNLKQVTTANKNISYLTDAQNRRVAKKVNGQLSQIFVYQSQNQIAAVLDGNANLVSRFVYASRSNVPDYMIKAGVTYRMVTDPIGSVRAVVDINTGSIAEQISYDEFGQILGDTNPGFQPFGFAGGLYDADTKLVHFGARDYDPETGRWLSKDPLLFGGGDANLYGYVFANPINNIDPSGLACGFSQTSGTIICIDDTTGEISGVGHGWSGNGAGKNNPGMQDVPNQGPIPQGSYNVGLQRIEIILGQPVAN